MGDTAFKANQAAHDVNAKLRARAEKAEQERNFANITATEVAKQLDEAREQISVLANRCVQAERELAEAQRIANNALEMTERLNTRLLAVGKLSPTIDHRNSNKEFAAGYAMAMELAHKAAQGTE